MADPRPHSAAYFGEPRDYWWNPDYIKHLAQHWDLRSWSRVLDVGCGMGHWHRVLAPHLDRDAQITGLDREPAWVVEAGRRFHAAPGMGGRKARFMVGDAQRLPFADASFDAVTCQTLLMHLPQPELALQEMKRVLRPGGWILTAEPNNLFNCLGWNDRMRERSVEDVMTLFELWLRYHRGKEKLGRGDNSLGERLPSLLLGAGFVDLELRQNDHASAVFPPYEHPEQRAVVRTMEEWKSSGTGSWDIDDLRTTFLAGGGDEGVLQRALALKRQWFDEELKDLEQKQFHDAGGGLFFVARARRRR
jgi:SAM-dependent methyltransferase